MSDLSTALRNRAEFFHNPDYVKAGFPGHLIEPLAAELIGAADEIERLQAELKQANALLQKWRDADDWQNHTGYMIDLDDLTRAKLEPKDTFTTIFSDGSSETHEAESCSESFTKVYGPDEEIIVHLPTQETDDE